MVAPNTRDLFKGKILKNYPFRNSQSKALKGIRSSFMQEEAFRCPDQGAFSLVYYITWPYNVTATQRHGWLWVWPSLNRWYAYIFVILVIVMLIRTARAHFPMNTMAFMKCTHTNEWVRLKFSFRLYGPHFNCVSLAVMPIRARVNLDFYEHNDNSPGMGDPMIVRTWH